MVTSNLSARSAYNELTSSPDLWGYTIHARYVRGDIKDTGVVGGISTQEVLYGTYMFKCALPACTSTAALCACSPMSY